MPGNDTQNYDQDRASVQLPSQHPVNEIKKVMKCENLKVHPELSVQATVVVLGLYAVLGTQPRVTCLDQCFTT